MHWILQGFEDTRRLAQALDHQGLSYSWHKVVPFVGDLIPPPRIAAGDPAILFGAYTLWRYAARHELKPGVFKIRPFVHERPWHPFLLNGAKAKFMTLAELPQRIAANDHVHFMRPVDDSKEEPGRVRSGEDLVSLAQKVLALEPGDIPQGALRPETNLMLTEPQAIEKEWQLWVVRDELVTWSLYKNGTRVTYRAEIDEDAKAFGQQLIAANPDYAPAYVLDICRTPDGLKMLETNCINAAGFYAADLSTLVRAISDLT